MIRSRQSHILALAGLVFLGAGVVARAQTLDIKTGLWETTVVSEVNGMPPIDTSKMTPETRAKVEAAMKGRGGQGPQTRTTKICLTKEKMDMKQFTNMNQNNSSCSNTVVSSSRSVMELKSECTGSNKSTGNLRFEALSRESMKGTFKILSGNADHPMTINVNMTGRWLGDDCGDVK